MERTKYPIQIHYDEKDGDYLAVVSDLPGCSAFGDTPEEALREAEVAIGLWLDAARKIGKPIPAPSVESEFSGKFNVRIPKSLHRDLALQANHEGVSLNHLVLSYISTGLSGRLEAAANTVWAVADSADIPRTHASAHQARHLGHEPHWRVRVAAKKAAPRGEGVNAAFLRPMTVKAVKSVAAALTQRPDRKKGSTRKSAKKK